MKKKIERFSATLVRILKARGLEGRLSEYHLFGRWEKAVGTMIARHARPEILRGKKLTVIVDSAAWMQQLSLLKPEIIEKVNRGLGKDAIREIALRLGEVAPSEERPEDIPARASLNAEDRAKIEQYTHDIADPGIREAIRHVMEKDFLSKKRTTTVKERKNS
jgi:predicted nucleic acid-binding Zn ribbon protein